MGSEMCIRDSSEQRIRIREWGRSEEYRIHDGEDRRRGAERQRERDNGRERADWRTPQMSRQVEKVDPHALFARRRSKNDTAT